MDINILNSKNQTNLQHPLFILLLINTHNTRFTHVTLKFAKRLQRNFCAYILVFNKYIKD